MWFGSLNAEGADVDSLVTPAGQTLLMRMSTRWEVGEADCMSAARDCACDFLEVEGAEEEVMLERSLSTVCWEK